MKKPKWIRPNEIYTIRYWFHLVLIAVVVLGILQYFQGGEMFTLKNILWSVPLLGIGDIISHSILKIN